MAGTLDELRARLESVIEAIGRLRALDGVANRTARVANRAVRKEPFHEVLSGSWLGHPLHPMLTDVVVGSFTSAWFLDLVPGEAAQRSSDVLIGIGLVSAAPTALSGLHDWTHTPKGPVRRMGFVHAMGNYLATVLYAWGLLRRLRGKRATGVGLTWAGAGVMTAAAYLGGHLTYREGIRVDTSPTGRELLRRGDDG